MSQKPDLAAFQEYKYRFNNPYALFEYMGVRPSRGALEGFMKRCDTLRKLGAKLPKKALQNEQRAFSDIQAGNYVADCYTFEDQLHMMNGLRKGHWQEDLDACSKFEQEQQQEWFGE